MDFSRGYIAFRFLFKIGWRVNGEEYSQIDKRTKTLRHRDHPASEHLRLIGGVELFWRPSFIFINVIKRYGDLIDHLSLQFKYMILQIFTCILHHLRVYYELPLGLMAQLVDHCQYRRVHGFESRSGLNLFQALISQLLKLCITAMINHVFITFSAAQIYDQFHIFPFKENKEIYKTYIFNFGILNTVSMR